MNLIVKSINTAHEDILEIVYRQPVYGILARSTVRRQATRSPKSKGITWNESNLDSLDREHRHRHKRESARRGAASHRARTRARESIDPGRLTTRVGDLRWFGGPWIDPRREDEDQAPRMLRKQSLQ